MIAIIVAMTAERVIGKNGTLPWHLPEDLKLFKQRTTGTTVIMGRKTYESIGRPLPHRNNIVVSSTAQDIPDVTVCRSVPEALAAAEKFGVDISVIGGASIYKEALPYTDALIISWVKENYEGDTYFPAWNIDEWEVAYKEDHGAFETVTYTRKQ
jgi:dihydrofolate reductase